MTDTTDPLYNARFHFEDIKYQVSKVARGHRKNSFDMQVTVKKWIKLPIRTGLLYIPPIRLPFNVQFKIPNPKYNAPNS